MFRSAVLRSVHIVMALIWCGVIAARPVALPCPAGGHGVEHGAHPAASAVGHAELPAGDHGTGHEHHVAVTNPTGDSTPADSVPAGHQCDCLGHCCAAVAELPAGEHERVVVALRPTEQTPGLSRHAYVAVWVDFVLPFAIAPPSLARA